jgi:hypothetical protein
MPREKFAAAQRELAAGRTRNKREGDLVRIDCPRMLNKTP